MALAAPVTMIARRTLTDKLLQPAGYQTQIQAKLGKLRLKAQIVSRWYQGASSA